MLFQGITQNSIFILDDYPLTAVVLKYINSSSIVSLSMEGS